MKITVFTTSLVNERNAVDALLYNLAIISKDVQVMVYQSPYDKIKIDGYNGDHKPIVDIVKNVVPFLREPMLETYIYR